MKSKNIKEVKSKVFETTDYDIFQTVKGNRVVSDKWVSTLSKKIETHNMDDPIMVTKDYKVIDGQHRLEACKLLGKPVRFYVMEGAQDSDVAFINSDRKKWKLTDYLDYYFKRGNKHYQQLKYLAEELELGVETSIMAGQRRVNRDSAIYDDFKSGDYKVADFGWACKFGEHYQELVKVVGKQAKMRYFLNTFAIFYKHPEFSFDRFKHAVKANMGQLLYASDRVTAIKTFEKIYNNQLKGRKFNKIKFSRWIEDRGYVEVTEKEAARRERGENQYTLAKKKQKVN